MKTSPIVGEMRERMAERILFLEGTMVQRHALEEAGFRRERFGDHDVDLKGNNDLLTLARGCLANTTNQTYCCESCSGKNHPNRARR